MKSATWCSATSSTPKPKDMYLSRVAMINAGLPHHTPAMTLNRLCGSGMQAIVSAAQTILLGDADIALAGGAESMSRAGYLMPTLRWGQRMGDGGTVDMMVGALTDPFDTVHMGITAENVAEKWKISRAQQDEFSVESHRRAINAIQKGYFKEQILPIELKTRKGVTLFDTDEHPRADASMEGMAKLRAAFKKDGTVTAGNASSINDGAAAVVLMEAGAAAKKGMKPMARLRRLWAFRRRPQVHGHRSGARGADGARARRPQGERHGRGRIERSVRRAGLRRGERSQIRRGEDQSQRRRGRAGPSDRRHRRACSRSRRSTNCGAAAAATPS